MTKTATISTNPLYGGKECPSQTETKACDCDVDCVMNVWVNSG
jgi:hypothetical protein